MKQAEAELYIGLMSGTSCDAIDAALLEISPNSTTLIATHSQEITIPLRNLITAFNRPEFNEIQQLGELDTCLGEAFADTCLQLINKAQITAQDIKAIGSHGQTIRHCPYGKYPFTIQIADPNIIACRTNITTIADFRRRDVALGGQGAPLAPGFHAFLLQDGLKNRWVLNVGGIANLTWLPAKENQQAIIAYDTGPGNCLLDSWCAEHQQIAYDHNGQWAAQGKVNANLLNELLQDDYFNKIPPKSTGRDYFNLQWLAATLNKLSIVISPVDIQATLLELTAYTISQAIHLRANHTNELWVCGGGSFNTALIQRLSILCSPINIKNTDACGIPAEWIEAAAFAWLAYQTVHRQAGNLPSVTGASQASILGAIYPAYLV